MMPKLILWFQVILKDFPLLRDKIVRSRGDSASSVANRPQKAIRIGNDIANPSVDIS
jgi:hypothetical protein